MNIEKLAPYAKAVAAFLVGLGQFAVILSTVVADSTVTADETITLFTSLIGWLGGAGAVYQVRNKKVKG